MKYKNEKPTPVLLGADLNAYSVAVAFHEAYGVRSYAMGKYKCGLTQFSRIVKMQFCSGFESMEVLLPELFSFAEKHKGEMLVLVPCADCYVEFIARYSKELSVFYNFYIPEISQISKMCNKERFYKKLREHGVPYPESISIKYSEKSEKQISDFEYPAVLKPSSSAEYWRHPFPDMKKVYYPETKNEALSIKDMIFNSGYRQSLILQRKIQNPEIYVYTVLMRRDGVADFGVFGKVVLEECGNTSSGNHSAIITMPENELCKRLKQFLKEEGYYGFANFDILFDGGRFYVLELNARQGRSCDHIRCAGINIAVRLMDVMGLSRVERVKKLFEKDKPYREIFWHYPKMSLALRYMKDREDRNKARSLKRAGEEFSALEYRPDIVFNPVRAAYCAIHDKRLAKAFKKDFHYNEKKHMESKNIMGVSPLAKKKRGLAE